MVKKTLKATVLFEEKTIGIGYLSNHPICNGMVVASIIPIDRFGSMKENNMTVVFGNPIHCSFNEDILPIDIFNEMLAQAEIEPEKVRFIIE